MTLTVLMQDRGVAEAGRFALRNAAAQQARDVDKVFFGSLADAKHQSILPRSFALLFPEEGLHPEDQMLDAQELAGLVASGSRIIVATHSLWMVYAWNNAIYAGQLQGIVEAFVVEFAPTLPGGYKLRPAIGDPTEGSIDERPLGWVGEQLGSDTNNILCRKRDKPPPVAVRPVAPPPSPSKSAGKPREPLICQVPSVLSLLHGRGGLTCFTVGCEICGGPVDRDLDLAVGKTP